MNDSNELTTTANVPGPVLDSVRVKAAMIARPVIERIDSMLVSTREEYAVADLYLDRVRKAQKEIDGHINPIMEPIKRAISDAQEGLRRLVDFKDALKRGLIEAETSLKDKMRNFQLAEDLKAKELERQKKLERDRLQQEEMERRREADRLARAAEEKRAAAIAAPDRQTRFKLEREGLELRNQQQLQQDAAHDLQQQSDLVVTTPATVPVRGAHSRVTKIKTWKVSDMSMLLAGIVSGEVPAGVVKVDEVALNSYWKGDQALVAMWPGIEVVEDIKIGGR